MRIIHVNLMRMGIIHVNLMRMIIIEDWDAGHPIGGCRDFVKM